MKASEQNRVADLFKKGLSAEVPKGSMVRRDILRILENSTTFVCREAGIIQGFISFACFANRVDLKFVDPDRIISRASNLGSDLHIRLIKKTIEKLHEDNMLVVAPNEADAPDLVAYPVDKKAKKKYMWADSERMAYEIQTNAREDAILANAKKKGKFNIPITWVSYDEEILNEIRKVTANEDTYLFVRV